MSLVQAHGLAIAGRLGPTDLMLTPASLTALVGPNGSGKTSLLHALARIGRPQGTVRIDGADVDRQGPSSRSRLLAYLPAAREAAWPLRARDLVALGGASRQAVEAMLVKLDLLSKADRRVDQLSTGERSRVLIARAMAPGPRLLLLDEPIANLDPLWQLRLMALLRAELAASGSAAIVAMHDLDAAVRFADRLIVMHEGTAVADGDPSAIIASPVIRNVFGIERSPDGWRPA
jgi:iron complex transport system ATP-binding protein